MPPRRRMMKTTMGKAPPRKSDVEADALAHLVGHDHHHHHHDHHHHHLSDDIPAKRSRDSNESDNDSDMDGCLHCHTNSTEVQVRCDECSAYICNSCHWCHEFQANHEIRVCDRCDAFYCRSCDEMDQCDDCGEVVCASCSTLLSCKFCGGGLCEECATACGRCGIVLCNRDSKFAVECDTCRLSYCLVCLASGSKDPCVRCGHRPSKRMEQLVHLRLKSIYKAFKQSSGGAPSLRGPNLRDRQDDDPDESYLTNNPESLMAAAATVANSGPPQSFCKTGSSKKLIGDKISDFVAQKEKADAAAAALLAELEEEEVAAKSKKSKKKRKKERLLAKREDGKKKDPETDSDDHEKMPENPGSSVEESNVSRSSPAEKSPYEQYATIEANPDSSSLAGQKVALDQADKDEMEDELEEMVANEDVEGLERLVCDMKGIPGRAILRKNAKKALKRLKTTGTESEKVPEASLERSCSRELDTSDPVATEESHELLRIVSHSQPKVPLQSRNAKARGDIYSARCECILEMAPVIVGWVIGKGGQRIRDLMEDSGARIWIDQESMGPTEPRVVYVSGSKKCVDNAVFMIHDLVSKAPAETPNQNTSTVDMEGQEKLANRDSKPGLLPRTTSPLNDGLAGKEATLKASARSEDVDTSENLVSSILTCEPRFVPLLIGRRGWTIKHIQDASGARVDIDQSVTPRKILISGSERSVQDAVRRVQEVLSYPHAQLQGHAVVAVEDFTDAVLHPSDPEVHNDESNRFGSPVDNDRPQLHSPPPSSLIMTGDAKGAISASSSLSSTPEPLIASSKGFTTIPQGTLLPPAYHPVVQAHGGGRKSAFTCIPPHDPSGVSALSLGEQMFVSPHPETLAFQSGSGQGTMDTRVDLTHPVNTNIYGEPQSNYLGGQLDPALVVLTSDMNNLPHDGHGAGQRGISHLPPRFNELGSQSHLPNQPSQSPWGNPGLVDPNAIGRNEPSQFRLDAAVEFLEHSKRLTPNQTTLMGLSAPLVSGDLSASIGLGQVGLQAPFSASVCDESDIVDRLFGLPPGEDGPESSVLTGLQGLSMEGNRLEIGIWGDSSTPETNKLSDADKKVPSPLFAAIRPSLTGNDHPAESRFVWGTADNFRS